MYNKIKTLVPSLFDVQVQKQLKKENNSIIGKNGLLEDEKSITKESFIGYKINYSEGTEEDKENILATIEQMLKEQGNDKVKEMFRIPEDKNLNELKKTMIEIKKSRFKIMVQSARSRFPNQYTRKSWKVFVRLMSEAMSAARAGDDGRSLDRAMAVLQRGMNGLRFTGVEKQEYKNLFNRLPPEDVQTPKVDLFKKFGKDMEQTPYTSGSQTSQQALPTASSEMAAVAGGAVAPAGLDKII